MKKTPTRTTRPIKTEPLRWFCSLNEAVNVTDSVKVGQTSLSPTEMEQMAMSVIDTYSTDTIVDIPRLRQEIPRLDLAAQIAE